MQEKDLMYISPYVRNARSETVLLGYMNMCDYDNVFTYIADGTLDYLTNGMHYVLKAGDGMLVPPFVPHFAHASEPVTMCVIHFDFFSEPERMTLKLIGAHEYEDIVHERVLHAKRESTIVNKIQLYSFDALDRAEIWEKCNMIANQVSCNASDFQKKASMINLIEALVRLDANNSSIEGNKFSSWPTVKRVIEYIEHNYKDPELTNDTIYTKTGACKSYLSTAFKNSTGQSIHSYLINMRISKAKELLSSGVSVTETGEMVGFSNIHSFSRAFKNATGRSPSEYALSYSRNV